MKFIQGSLKLEKSYPGTEASGESASVGTADRGLSMPGPTSNVSRTNVGESMPQVELIVA